MALKDLYRISNPRDLEDLTDQFNRELLRMATRLDSLDSVVSGLSGSGSLSGYTLSTGWVLDTDTWTRISANSFLVSGKDVTQKLYPGTRLEFTQGSEKYALVASSALSAIGTVITLQGGSDYYIDNATIQNPKYSYSENPAGWPGWFNYNETWLGFSVPPLRDGMCRFTTFSRLAVMVVNRFTSGTSNSTETWVSVPIASSKTSPRVIMYGRGTDSGSFITTTPCRGVVRESSSLAQLYSDASDGLWTDSGSKNWTGILMWEF